MTAYIPVDLQRQIRDRFENRCAYCQTAEHLTATTFEFEHILPRSDTKGTRHRSGLKDEPAADGPDSSNVGCLGRTSTASVMFRDP